MKTTIRTTRARCLIDLAYGIPTTLTHYTGHSVLTCTRTCRILRTYNSVRVAPEVAP